MPDIHTILKDYWGYDTFRPLQQEIINSVIAKKDTLALLPTGGGKSICYQVPALAQEGICLVISPLIALMKDQVENLRKRGIMALAIYSGMSRRQIVQTLKNASGGPYKLLYISPERIETSLFEEYLPALGINLIAVDEAHCISQWGYDFRPAYLRISELRNQLPGVPILALTASATREVQKDICEKLLFTNSQVYRQSYERKNLSYSVFKVDAKINKLIQIISNVPGTMIVYCKSRKRTQEIQQLLQMHHISSHSYHAGLPQEERTKKQQDWIENTVRVIVCTNAFGMGIDKPDVRAVVHIDMPDSLENYYQEAGRAGRDGKKAYAVLLAEEKDSVELEELHAVRFPDFEQIKNVYGALVNYLQIPVHSGQDISYTFKFEEFIKNFKLNSNTTLYALKALEGDGWIYFNEKSFAPSTVVFTTSKQQLYAYYKSYPQYEELLTTLLRTYEGIFDFPVSISEMLIATLLKKDMEAVKKYLREASALSIIKYTPQTDAPQIIFRKNRVAANDLKINLNLYNQRRESFKKRVAAMLNYVQTTTCRSRFVNTYFGDAETPACGICDNCLQAKSLTVSDQEFDAISQKIKHQLSIAPLVASQLLIKLNGTPKEKAWKVIDFLQAERIIYVDNKGLINLVV